VLLRGVGARNGYLCPRLASHSGKNVKLLTTDKVGVNGYFKEAIAFAVLAYWRSQGFPGNLPAPGAVFGGEIHSGILTGNGLSSQNLKPQTLSRKNFPSRITTLRSGNFKTVYDLQTISIVTLTLNLRNSTIIKM
jgi:hypothetical protein